MIKLDAKSAAERIRADVVGIRSVSLTAEARHILAFAKDVCAELGLEPDPHSIMAVGQALERAGIQPHVAEEYPKMLTENGKPVLDEHGNCVVFNSAEEEKNWKPGEKPVEGLPKALEYPKPLFEDGQPVRDSSGVPIVFLDSNEERDYWSVHRTGTKATHDNESPRDVAHEDTDKRPKPKK